MILHIDGRHFYEDAKSDFEQWLPKLSKNAIFLFHDTEVRERDSGVWKLFDERSQKYPSFNFHRQHGLGVLVLVGLLPRQSNAPVRQAGSL
ncbi:class I SAM-dependent methyltransferase [Martelella sp. AD-3]|uniref:class I SAM-dependent methyltransferase n=1 Tax=Martelella sp. AD-3 TaxID=686597 RepID=UPI000467BFE7|nr:class I SAM-dependent methyltransferase [Martelella sp. AD-3]AMM86134.1 hypothetical protein AZF01_18800 [Martelella sp. AD-3]